MTRYPFDSMTPKPLEVSVADGRLKLTSQFEHKLGIEAIPGSRRAGKGRDYWTLPITYTSFRLLESTFPNAVYDDPASAAKADLVSRADAGRALGVGLDDETHDSIREMMGLDWVRGYQIDGAVFLGSVRGAALLDEPGLGKTAQVAAALSLYDDTLPALVVCPKSLLINWQRELTKFGIKSEILHGDAAKRRKILEAYDHTVTPVLITTYEMVKAYSRIGSYGTIKLNRCETCAPHSLDNVSEEKCDVHERELNRIPWSTIVVDEAHRISNPSTVQTRAVWGVADGSTYRWAITATPMEQSMVEFWALLRFLDPEEWSTSTKYRDRWAMQHTNYFGVTEVLGVRPDRADEFSDVTGWRWIRRLIDPTKMPDKLVEYRMCELSAKESKAYKSMAKQMMAEVPLLGTTETAVLVAENHMVKTGYLIRMASGSLAMTDSGKVIGLEPSAKLDLMEDTLDDFVGQPVIVWFNYRDTLSMAAERLLKRGVSFVTVDGSQSIENRQASVDAFQNGDVDYILLTAGAGSEGITLTRSRVAIVVERPWSSRLNKQLDGRHYRIGSEIHDSVVTVNLVTRGTVEEDLYDAQAEKEERVQEVLKDYESRVV